MTQHFKGKYKLSCPIDQSTNDFPKTLKGTNEEADIYIPCAKNGQISYYGHGVLEYYIPSLQSGNNIIREIYAKFINEKNVDIKMTKTKNASKDIVRTSYSIIDNDLFENELTSNKHIITHIKRTDGEVIFRFRTKDFDKIVGILKPRTSGAKTSVFSNKNLPKSEYTIPDEDFNMYNSIIENNPNITCLNIAHMTNNYIKSLATKRNPISNIKADMKLKKLKGREYIHKIGKWNEYIKFIKSEIQKESG